MRRAGAGEIRDLVGVVAEVAAVRLVEGIVPLLVAARPGLDLGLLGGALGEQRRLLAVPVLLVLGAGLLLLLEGGDGADVARGLLADAGDELGLELRPVLLVAFLALRGLGVVTLANRVGSR